MNKFLLAASAAVAALAMAPAANAATTITLSGTPLSGTFGNTVSGDFTDIFEFSFSGAGNASGSVTSVALNGIGAAGDISFSSITIDGTAFTPLFTGANEWFVLSPTLLAADTVHTLKIVGSSIGSSSYGGQLAIAAVPEPATWAMMIAGVAAVGVAMRRRSQNVRVAFS